MSSLNLTSRLNERSVRRDSGAIGCNAIEPMALQPRLCAQAGTSARYIIARHTFVRPVIYLVAAGGLLCGLPASKVCADEPAIVPDMAVPMPAVPEATAPEMAKTPESPTTLPGSKAMPKSVDRGTAPEPQNAGTPPRVRHKRATGRPAIPASFDHETVQRLLDTIEEPHHASVLKLGYFFRRGNHALPVRHGFLMLQETLDKEAVGSNRWFLLQGVRGWAAVRCPELAPRESLTAYRAIFAQAGLAQENGAAYALSQVVSEFVLGVSGPFGNAGLLGGEQAEAKALMLQAWTAYSSYVSAHGRWPGLEPAWAEAIAAGGFKEALIPEIEKLLADVKAPKTYGTYMLAAGLLGGSKPARGVELLRLAKPLMPRDKSGQELPGEVSRYADQMVGFLLGLYLNQEVKRGKKRNEAKLREAIDYQKYKVVSTGHGWARLVQLQCWNEDQKGLKSTLNQLTAPRVSPWEINDAAEMLMNLWQETEQAAKTQAKQTKNQKERGHIYIGRKPDPEIKYPYAGWQAVILLSGYMSHSDNLRYLNRGEESNLEQELRARRNLAAIYINTAKLEEARRVMDIKHLQVDVEKASSQARYYLSELAQMEEERRRRLVAARS